MKAGRPSNTARLIAAATLLRAGDPDGASRVPPGAEALCRAFLSGSAADRMLAAGMRRAPVRWFWRWLEARMVPGIVDHFARRKAWIERQCRAGREDGFSRLVVIGAGFDTLGLRLAREFPDLEVLEIDHPATQEVKRRALEACGMAPGPNFGFSAADLSREPLPPAAGAARPTLFILEGLLMYLPEAEVGRLFDSLRRDPAERVRVIFSFMRRWPDGGAGFRPQSPWVRRWLAWSDEPFAWSIDPERLAAFLAEAGFELREQVRTRELSGDATGMEGEDLAWCWRAAL